MNYIKLLFSGFVLSLLLVTSCTNSDSFVEELPDPQESASLQVAINHLQSLYDSNGVPIAELHPSGNLIFDFCFEFVFPIELIYNNGTIATINSLNSLILVLISQTPDLFIVGIEFPFEVTVYNPDTDTFEVITINNEADFITLLQNCLSDCGCTDHFDPVCVEVQTDGGPIIVTFSNACYAECEGFTPNDFINCSNDVCSITNLNIEMGDCGNNNTYPLTIDFHVENPVNDFFDVFVRNNEYIGTYAIADLPLTIEEFNLSGLDYDYVKVCINDVQDCCAEIEWMAPDCTTNECQITDLKVYPGYCNPDSDTYELFLTFEHQNAGNALFDVFLRNDEYFGTYELANLPIIIENFPLSGLEYDFVKVCINDVQDCCQEIEWLAPNCPPTCNCTTEYDPVCVEIGGTTITYFNACFAECDGFSGSDFVNCTYDCSVCVNAPYDPVCVEIDGVVVTYYNECMAYCDGFTPNDYVYCN